MTVQIRTIIPARGRKLALFFVRFPRCYFVIRTIIPARGRKHEFIAYDSVPISDKNHNPRKGTETARLRLQSYQGNPDKNHNPRKGTETRLPF